MPSRVLRASTPWVETPGTTRRNEDDAAAKTNDVSGRQHFDPGFVRNGHFGNDPPDFDVERVLTKRETLYG